MKKTTLILLLLVSFLLPVRAQQVGTALSTLATQYPVEKAYIHYDKEYYVAGETIWFKAYLYSNGMPSTLSDNFYIQLAAPDGKVMVTKKYPVKGATIKGDFDLPDSIPQGYYHIRALTPAMMNNYHDLLYTKTVFVFNPASRTESTPGAAKPSALSVQFFPESGHLLAEAASVIAFKATDLLGNPVTISGVIKTDDGTLINSFKTQHNGMGKIQFRAQAGKKYLAVIDLNGQTGSYPLPEVEEAGINLRVENEKAGKMFLLSRSRKNKDDYNKLTLVAQMNNLIVYESEIDFESYFSVKGHLLTDSLPSGILHFTVFDKDGKPLAERLSFVNNGEYESKSEIGIVKKGTGPREENVFEINFPDLIQRSCSVSITDAEISSSNIKDNIITKLLLTDELKGYIENPAWYFQDRTDTMRESALDNLMLTHGWTRFSWKKILAGEFPEKKYKDNYLISVGGTIKDSKTNAPVSGGNLTVFLESEDSVNHSFEIIVRDDGKFTIDSLLFFGKAKFFYVYTTPQGREKPVSVTLDGQINDLAVGILPYGVSEKDLAAMNAGQVTEGAFINKRYSTGSSSVLTKTKELDPVTVESKTNKRPIDVVNEKYTSGLFASMGRVNIDLINQPEHNRALSVYDYVKRSIRNVNEQNGNFVNARNFDMFKPSTDAWYETQQKKLDSTIINGGPGQPGDRFIDKGMREKGDLFVIAIYVNESPTDINFLKTIRMDNIALIKFYEPGFIGAGSSGPGGTLAVYTKNEVTDDAKIEKLDYIPYKGYSLTKEFYHPDYSVPNPKQTQEDTRTTLYWNPDVYTGAGSKNVQMKFYNNDFSKKLKIVVEGFDATGRLIHIEKMIEN